MALAPAYSIVIPIYNDGYLARAMCEELARVFAPIPGSMELIFVNDGSQNDSLTELRSLLPDFGFVSVIDLSRNFGQHQALACGFREAKGDIVIRINVDRQDPPAELPKLLHYLEQEDYDLVIGEYQARKSPWKDRLTSAVYFWLFHLLTGIPRGHNSAPMRVMSRRYIDAYNQLTEKSRFPQGLDHWLGFRQRYVVIEHQARIDKKSSYTFWSRLHLALNGILSFSDRPIKLVVILGFLFAGLGMLLGAYFVVTKLLGNNYMPGYVSLISLGLVTFGIQLTSLGIIGLYIGRIFQEAQNRPLYLIREIYKGKK